MYDDGEHNAQDNHRGYGKIKTEVLLFYTDVARKASKPVKFVGEEVDDDAQGNDDGADYNNDFA